MYGSPAEIATFTYKDTIEHQWRSSNLNTIVTHNLSDTYPILRVQNCPTTVGH